MKGMIFTEFLEMVETRFSVEVVDEILDACRLASGGSYTSLGTYDHSEILAMVDHLAKVTKESPETLQALFGEYLFARLAASHAQFLHGIASSFDLLQKVQSFIHVEVCKLYPDASPPQVHCELMDAHRMQVHYRSYRPFAALALGLIRGVAAHYGEKVAIKQESVVGALPGTEAVFHLSLASETQGH